MVFTEITQGEAIEVPAMSRVAKGAEIGVMWRHDDNAPAGHEKAMKLFQGPHYVHDMFYDVNGANLSKCGIAEWERKMIEIGDDVGVCVWVLIDADRAWIFVDSAAYIQNRNLPAVMRRRTRRVYRSSSRKHASSVSAANSAWSRVITRGGHSRRLFGPQPSVSNPCSKASISSRSRKAGARSLVFCS